MDDATRQRLSDINRAFYSTVAAEFDRSRAQPWAGWQPLLPHLAALPPMPRVLDIGCGNGRFGHFLTQHLGAMRYTGVDYSPEMLQITRKRLPDAQLLARDLVSEAPPAGLSIWWSASAFCTTSPALCSARRCFARWRTQSPQAGC